jgi:hypothetical protein
LPGFVPLGSSNTVSGPTGAGREYGFPSWTALHTEIQSRRRLSATGRWSFGGATAIETAVGTLSIAGLVSGPDHATVDAWLLPARQTPTPVGQTSEEQLNAILARSGGSHTPRIR